MSSASINVEDEDDGRNVQDVNLKRDDLSAHNNTLSTNESHVEFGENMIETSSSSSLDNRRKQLEAQFEAKRQGCL